jgi:hypothetical protein
LGKQFTGKGAGKERDGGRKIRGSSQLRSWMGRIEVMLGDEMSVGIAGTSRKRKNNQKQIVGQLIPRIMIVMGQTRGNN